MRTLLVENDIRRVLAMKEAGRIPSGSFVVATAHEAVLAIRAEAFREVWLDYDLEGRQKGSEAARALAGAPWRPSRVVIHSANSSGGFEMNQILLDAGLHPEWTPITSLIPGLVWD